MCLERLHKERDFVGDCWARRWHPRWRIGNKQVLEFTSRYIGFRTSWSHAKEPHGYVNWESSLTFADDMLLLAKCQEEVGRMQRALRDDKLRLEQLPWGTGSSPWPGYRTAEQHEFSFGASGAAVHTARLDTGSQLRGIDYGVCVATWQLVPLASGCKGSAVTCPYSLGASRLGTCDRWCSTQRNPHGQEN